MTIVNLRATHGGGKSYVIRQILKRYNAVPESLKSNGRPNNYVMSLSDSSTLYVVGDYTTECGGCDGIQPYALIWPRVEEFAKHGHVLFEGALISTNYGTIGTASEQYGDDFVFAFLDTPLSVCLNRISLRRLAKGNTKPLNPYQTTWKHKAVLSLYDRFRDERGRRTVLIDYRKALPQLLGLFYNSKDQ